MIKKCHKSILVICHLNFNLHKFILHNFLSALKVTQPPVSVVVVIINRRVEEISTFTISSPISLRLRSALSAILKPELPGACSWKMPNSVFRKENFLILLYSFYKLFKRPTTLWILKNFETNQFLKKAKFVFFCLEKAQPGNPALNLPAPWQTRGHRVKLSDKFDSTLPPIFFHFLFT